MFDYDYKNVKPYLSTGIKKNNREMPWAFVITSCATFPIPYLADLIEQADTFKIILASIVGPIELIMIIWSIYLALTFDKNERYYALYLGIVSQAMGITFLGIAIKFNYIALHNKISISFIIMSIVTYLFVVWLSLQFIFKRLKADYFRKPIKFKHPKLLLLIPGIGGLAIIVGRILTSVLNYNGILILISIIFLVTSYPCAIGVHNIYKYMLIRHYETYKKEETKK